MKIADTFKELREAMNSHEENITDTSGLQEKLRIDILEQQTTDLNRVANALEKCAEILQNAVDAG